MSEGQSVGGYEQLDRLSSRMGAKRGAASHKNFGADSDRAFSKMSKTTAASGKNVKIARSMAGKEYRSSTQIERAGRQSKNSVKL